MGSFLDKPKADKETKEGEGCGLRFATAAMQGWRGSMEDAHSAVTGLKDLPDWCFFGVYDGHAGVSVSKHVSDNLLSTILSTEGFKDCTDTEKVKQGIRQGFLDLDEAMASPGGLSDGKDHSGTTVIVVVLSPTHIYFANCGDSRGILCRSNAVEFATADHKPSNKDEKARIEKAGGNVLLSRVNGSLAVSRALGDFAFKHLTELAATEQMVSPEPDVTIIERQPDNDQFILLACDGVWDVMTNENAQEYIAARMQETDSLGSVLNNLLDYCLYKDSKDNMTAVIIAFPNAPNVVQEAQEKEKALSAEACQAIEEKINDIVVNSDPLDDLDELSVTQSLERTLNEDFFLISRRKLISEVLQAALARKDAAEKAAAAATTEPESTPAQTEAPATLADDTAGDAAKDTA